MNQYANNQSIDAVEQLMQLYENFPATAPITHVSPMQLIRQEIERNQVTFIRLTASVGSGKISLLLLTLARLNPFLRITILLDELTSEKDKSRLQNLGIPTYQIPSDSAGQVDPTLLQTSLSQIDLKKTDLLLMLNNNDLSNQDISDLGEDVRVTVLSSTEGDDKPMKYPYVFLKQEVLLISKSDLFPYIPFSMDALEKDAQTINPGLRIIPVSTRSGEGLDTWCQWILEKVRDKYASV